MTHESTLLTNATGTVSHRYNVVSNERLVSHIDGCVDVDDTSLMGTVGVPITTLYWIKGKELLR